MCKHSIAWCFTLIFAWTAFLAEPLAAEPNQQVITVLDAGWGGSSASLDAAERQFNSASGDSHVDYAMALVSLRHRKYERAQKHLESAVAKDRTNLPAWRALFWLDMFTRKFDASLARMHLLSKLYPDTKARAEVEKDLKESAQWMGQLIGYLEGPAKKAIAAETVAANKQAIMSELSGQWRQTFDAGKQQVLDQFFQLQDELVKKRAQALEDEKKEKATELESIAQERSRITSELDNLKSKGDASKTEMDGKLSEIDKYLAPVARRARDLKFRADPVLRRMRDLKVRIGRAEADERNAGDDKNRRDRARRDGDRLRNELRREEIRLRPIDTEMRRVQGEGARLVSQRTAAQSRYQITLRSLTIQRKKLERTVKSLDKKERIVSKPATGRSPRVSDLERRLSALSTYRAFPLEEARISLLESARK